MKIIKTSSLLEPSVAHFSPVQSRQMALFQIPGLRLIANIRTLLKSEARLDCSLTPQADL